MILLLTSTPDPIGKKRTHWKGKQYSTHGIDAQTRMITFHINSIGTNPYDMLINLNGVGMHNTLHFHKPHKRIHLFSYYEYGSNLFNNA
jgi:hypothetical protein